MDQHHHQHYQDQANLIHFVQHSFSHCVCVYEYQFVIWPKTPGQQIHTKSEWNSQGHGSNRFLLLFSGVFIIIIASKSEWCLVKLIRLLLLSLFKRSLPLSLCCVCVCACSYKTQSGIKNPRNRTCFLAQTIRNCLTNLSCIHLQQEKKNLTKFQDRIIIRKMAWHFNFIWHNCQWFQRDTIEY